MPITSKDEYEQAKGFLSDPDVEPAIKSGLRSSISKWEASSSVSARAGEGAGFDPVSSMGLPKPQSFSNDQSEGWKPTLQGPQKNNFSAPKDVAPEDKRPKEFWPTKGAGPLSVGMYMEPSVDEFHDFLVKRGFPPAEAQRYTEMTPEFRAFSDLRYKAAFDKSQADGNPITRTRDVAKTPEQDPSLGGVIDRVLPGIVQKGAGGLYALERGMSGGLSDSFANAVSPDAAQNLSSAAESTGVVGKGLEFAGGMIPSSPVAQVARGIHGAGTAVLMAAGAEKPLASTLSGVGTGAALGGGLTGLQGGSPTETLQGAGAGLAFGTLGEAGGALSGVGSRAVTKAFPDIVPLRAGGGQTDTIRGARLGEAGKQYAKETPVGQAPRERLANQLAPSLLDANVDRGAIEGGKRSAEVQAYLQTPEAQAARAPMASVVGKMMTEHAARANDVEATSLNSRLSRHINSLVDVEAYDPGVTPMPTDGSGKALLTKEEALKAGIANPDDAEHVIVTPKDLNYQQFRDKARDFATAAQYDATGMGVPRDPVYQKSILPEFYKAGESFPAAGPFAESRATLEGSLGQKKEIVGPAAAAHEAALSARQAEGDTRIVNAKNQGPGEENLAVADTLDKYGLSGRGVRGPVTDEAVNRIGSYYSREAPNLPKPKSKPSLTYTLGEKLGRAGAKAAESVKGKFKLGGEPDRLPPPETPPGPIVTPDMGPTPQLPPGGGEPPMRRPSLPEGYTHGASHEDNVLVSKILDAKRVQAVLDPKKLNQAVLNGDKNNSLGSYLSLDNREAPLKWSEKGPWKRVGEAYKIPPTEPDMAMFNELRGLEQSERLKWWETATAEEQQAYLRAQNETMKGGPGPTTRAIDEMAKANERERTQSKARANGDATAKVSPQARDAARVDAHSPTEQAPPSQAELAATEPGPSSAIVKDQGPDWRNPGEPPLPPGIPEGEAETVGGPLALRPGEGDRLPPPGPQPGKFSPPMPRIGLDDALRLQGSLNAHDALRGKVALQPQPERMGHNAIGYLKPGAIALRLDPTLRRLGGMGYDTLGGLRGGLLPAVAGYEVSKRKKKEHK